MSPGERSVEHAQRAIWRITSAKPDLAKVLGTGFPVHKDGDGQVYIVTCSHVVDAVGGPDNVQADGKKAKVIAQGDPVRDLAVLSVKSPEHRAILTPSEKRSRSGREIRVVGFRIDGKDYHRHPLAGRLASELITERDGSE